MNTTTCPLGGECGGTGWLWSPGRGYPDPEPPEWYPCRCNPRAEGDPNQLLDYRGAHARIAKAEATLRELARLKRAADTAHCIAIAGGSRADADAAYDALTAAEDAIADDYGDAPEPF